MALTAAAKRRLKDLLASVKAGAEDRPGVYRMMGEGGEVVYVGKSKRLRSRLLSYFRAAYPEEKGARIVREAFHIEWSYTPSEFAALLEELRLVKRFRPRFNVALKRDARHYAFIAITRGRAPRLQVLRGTGGVAAGTVYGPFVGAERLRVALRELSDSLGLRDCSLDGRMRFSDQQEMFALPPVTPGCIRYEVGKCLGPCIAAITSRKYNERVRQARSFFEGDNDGPIERLEEAMSEASAQLAFERAASLRDKAQRLKDLRSLFDRLRFAVETLSFLYSVPGVQGDDRVYVIRRGVVRAERPAPRNTADEGELRELAREIFGSGPAAGLPTHEIDELLIVTSWFRYHPGELERTEGWTGQGTSSSSATTSTLRPSELTVSLATLGLTSNRAGPAAPGLTTS